MRNLNRFAFVATATVAALGFTVPAQADVHQVMQRLAAEQGAKVESAACHRSLGAAACGDYQSKLLSDVAHKVLHADPAASQSAVSGRQLDALIASIN